MLLKRMFAIEMEGCPRCHQATLWIIAAIAERSIMRLILTQLKLAADPRSLNMLNPLDNSWRGRRKCALNFPQNKNAALLIRVQKEPLPPAA